MVADPPAPGPYLDRARATRLMAAAGIDALVLSEPQAFLYATGCPQGVTALFRRAGGAFALVPADPGLSLGAVINDFIELEFTARSPVRDIRVQPAWVETIDAAPWAGEPHSAAELAALGSKGRLEGFRRPTTFDIRRALRELKDLLAVRGLGRARLGFELDFIPANDLAAIASALGDATIVDASPVVDALRSVKAPGEIARLRLGCELGEAGIAAIIAEAIPGLAAEDFRQIYRSGVQREAAARGIATLVPSWEYISVGPDPVRSGGRVDNGSIIKVDVGCVIDGYSSDTSRNLVFGEATAQQRELHDALENAFAEGVALLAPGRRLADVHRVATAAMHARGFTPYQRGHFGHGLGDSFFSEQWPFISADSAATFEPGMVVAFEIPFTLLGVGAFNLEDQFLITPDGHEAMNRLPRRLLPAGVGS